MKKAVHQDSTLPTLVELWYGTQCPHEEGCACRSGGWCPHAKCQLPNDEPEFPMLHLVDCSFRNPACCCRVLTEIEMLAEQYLRQANVKEPPVPVDVVHLLDEKRQIEIRLLPLKSCFGASWFLGEEWVIHLNANVPSDENRFTAFHEGFHIVCRNYGLMLSRSNNGCRPLGERLADYFAASILMPRTFVVGLWPEVKNLGEMATIFNVPEEAAYARLTRLGVL